MKSDMAITFVIDRFRQRMLTQADGVVTFEEVNRHIDEEERARALDLPELIDARGAKTDITPEEVRRLIRRTAHIARTMPLGRTAIVTTDDMAFGMARMYSILTERLGAAVEVFRDLDSAERWLHEGSTR
jgi:hypothetical protein